MEKDTRKPHLSYTIWFSQRTGSTLLCKALASTGVAGNPNEWLEDPGLFEHYQEKNYTGLREHLWQVGSSPNRVFGLKFSFYEPHFTQILNIFKAFPDAPRPPVTRATLWEYAFPNHRHIFMTRRNKIRLAVSWWKAIQTHEWHRIQGAPPSVIELSEAYSFEAINHLLIESSLREAGIQEFFSEASIIPLTLVYEDFVQDYEATIHGVFDYLNLDRRGAPNFPPYFAKMADEVNEAWVERFREERQQGWENRGW